MAHNTALLILLSIQTYFEITFVCYLEGKLRYKNKSATVKTKIKKPKGKKLNNLKPLCKAGRLVVKNLPFKVSVFIILFSKLFVVPYYLTYLLGYEYCTIGISS